MTRPEQVSTGLATAGIGLMLLAPTAQAQDWQPLDVGRDISAVAVQWDSGAALAVQCRRDGLFAMLKLVHPVTPSTGAAGDSVSIGYDHAGGERRESWMLNDDGGAAFAPTPERFARRLLTGGDVQLVVTPAEGPRQRYPLSLPADPTHLAAVLEACDVPQTDPLDNPPRTVSTAAPAETDESARPQLGWIRRATGQDLANAYPERSLERGLNGRATVSCLVQRDGRLRDCEIITEYPRGGDFGPATVGVSERAFVLGTADGGPLPEWAAGSRIELPMVWMSTRVR